MSLVNFLLDSSSEYSLFTSKPKHPTSQTNIIFSLSQPAPTMLTQGLSLYGVLTVPERVMYQPGPKSESLQARV